MMSSWSGNHIIIKNAVSKETCALSADYIKLKARAKPNRKNKDFLTDVHREYADPLMETLLERLKPVIESATGLELWPTLSFCYLYTSGRQLEPHKDRSSCQIVAGLCIGADEKFRQTGQSWPLIIEEAGKEHSVELEDGDLVIFKGSERRHWRTPFSGEWFVSAIFAYVDKNGPYQFQKFDQRKMLGKPHVGMFRWSFGCLKNRIKSLF